MPDLNINKDEARMLDILASGTATDETNDFLKTKLGVDDDHIRSWGVSKTHKDPAIRDEFNTIVTERINLNRTKKEPEIEIPGVIRASGKAYLQGLSFGFSDEIQAGFEAGFDAIKKGDPSVFKSSFDTRIKKERDELKQLEKEFPLQFIAAELAGAFSVPIPGVGLIKAARTGTKVAKTGGKLIGKLAAESAVQSAGKAESPLGSRKFLEEVGKGTGFGVAGGVLLGKAGKGAAKLAKAGGEPVKKAAQAVSAILFDLPPSYTERLLNPRTAQKILNPKSSNDIVESIVGITDTMGKQAKALSLKAQQKLSTEKNIDIGQIINQVKGLPSFKKIERSTLQEAVKAQRSVQSVFKDLAERSGDAKMLSEVDLKHFVQDIDNEIPWNKMEWKLKDNIFGDIRSAVDNGILKTNNIPYAEAMKPVSSIMKNVKEISKSFSLKREGFKTTSSDATFSKIKGFFDVTGASKKPVTEDALKKAEGLFAGPGKPSILEDIELSQIARRTEGGQAAGSRNVLQGVLAGSLVGAPVWGLVAGAVKDKYSRAIGKKVLPSAINAIKQSDEAMAQFFSKFDPDKAQNILQIFGRTTGVKTGISAAQEQGSLLPRQQPPQFGAR